jgi:hypothetical protein
MRNFQMVSHSLKRALPRSTHGYPMPREIALPWSAISHRAQSGKVDSKLTKDRPRIPAATTIREEVHALRFSLLYALINYAPSIG